MKKGPIIFWLVIFLAIGAIIIFNNSPPQSKTETTITASQSSSHYSSAQKNDRIIKNVPPGKYILNTNTKKFHKPSCSSVQQMDESHMKGVDKSRDQIIADGYSPCGRCNP